jgi:hypothetical protein
LRSRRARLRFANRNQHAMVYFKGQYIYSEWYSVPNFAVSHQGCTSRLRLIFQ